jgi:hypothetical protein
MSLIHYNAAVDVGGGGWRTAMALGLHRFCKTGTFLTEY